MVIISPIIILNSLILVILKIANILPFKQMYEMAKKQAKKEKVNLNRLRIVLAERNITNRWLADQLSVTEGTVSKWSTNTYQPPLETLYEISIIFNIDIHELIASTMPKK